MQIRNVSCLYAHQIERRVGPLDREFQNSGCFDVTETVPSGGIFSTLGSNRITYQAVLGPIRLHTKQFRLYMVFWKPPSHISTPCSIAYTSRPRDLA